jgi:exportin-2 (importin alpha re-exporter)
VNAGVLQTAHSIFKRYRHEFRTDELFTEIKFVLEKFCPAFLDLFKVRATGLSLADGRTRTR